MNAMGSVSQNYGGELTRLPVEYSERRWYAAYTCAQHEKRVAEQFTQRALENFLPQYASVRRWKDRRVRLELPLFPGDVFVRLALRERLRVLETPSVVRLVGFNGRPAALPDKEIEALQACAAAQINTERQWKWTPRTSSAFSRAMLAAGGTARNFWQVFRGNYE